MRAPPQHGTVSGYVNIPCSCDACREAVRVYQRERRKGIRLADPSRWRHGEVSTYSNYGCRCLACSAASHEYRAARWRRQKALRAEAAS
jgi:hypothetical protein